MPDSTSLPRFPAVLRNLTGRESEQGTDAPLSTTPRRPSAAVNGSTRPLPSLYGRIARAEQVGTRWRDIQWVDFTSDPDSGAAASEPDPVPAAEVPEAAKIPEGDGALLHFRKSPGAMIEPTADAIPGLATRFTRLSVPRLSPVPRPPGYCAGTATAQTRAGHGADCRACGNAKNSERGARHPPADAGCRRRDEGARPPAAVGRAATT
jgi:hypothetical protein